MHTTVKLAALAALASLAVPAHAQSVFVIANGTDGANTGYQFGTIDLQTGNFTNIANNAAYQFIYGLGFGSNGTLYALKDAGTPSSPELDEFTIDQGTGALSNEVVLTGDSLFGGSANAQGVFTGLTDPGSASDGKLFTFDLAAGTFTLGAQTLVNPDGLVVPDGMGNIYASDRGVLATRNDGLDKVFNTTTGAAQFVGDTGVADVFTGMFINGSLFTVAQGAGSALNVYTLNTGTSAANFVTGTSFDNSASVQAIALAPTPEPSPVVAVVVGMLGLGGLTLRARRKSSVRA